MSFQSILGLPTISKRDEYTLVGCFFQDLEDCLASSIEDGQRLSNIVDQVTGLCRHASQIKGHSYEDTVQIVCLVSQLQYTNGKLQNHLEQVKERSPSADNNDSDENPTEYDPKEMLSTLNFILQTQRMVSTHSRLLIKLLCFLWKVGAFDVLLNVETIPQESRSCYSPELSPLKTICIRRGKWIRTYGSLDLEVPETGTLTRNGVLLKEYEKQCDNIVLLEKERNALLLEVVRLGTESAALSKKIDELTQANKVLRNKLKKQN